VRVPPVFAREWRKRGRMVNRILSSRELRIAMAPYLGPGATDMSQSSALGPSVTQRRAQDGSLAEGRYLEQLVVREARAVQACYSDYSRERQKEGGSS
jgi:hypothetical protein